MKKIKIVQITYSFEVGGTETIVLELCNKLDKKKYEVHLLILTNDKLKLVESLSKDVNIHYLNFNTKQLKSSFGFINGLKELISLLQVIKPSIIHTHSLFITLLFITLAIRLSKIKTLHFRTVHTAGLFYENQKTVLNKTRLLIEKVAMRLTKTYLISISNIVHQNNNFYFKNVVKDIRLISNGIDFTKYNKQSYAHITKNDFNFPPDCILISYIARLDRGKNHEFLIDIWNDIIQQIPNAVLCFAGDGILKDYLIQKVKDNNTQGSIRFLGSINNVPELLSITDIGVFPSSFEGFGLVMLEKFAMKLPVVASNIEAFKEIVKGRENIFLHSLEDKNGFINSIVTLCKDSQLRKQIGEKNLLVAQKFSIENTIKLHDEYYMNYLKQESIK